MTARIQRPPKPFWVAPEGVVDVSLRTPWGNPYTVRRQLQHRPAGDDRHDAGEPYPGRWEYAVINLHTGEHIQTHQGRYGDPEQAAHRQCVELYETITLPNRLAAGMNLADLAGRTLACTCEVTLPCHADLLIKTAQES